MKITSDLAILLAALVLSVTAAGAQVTVDITKVTCREFLLGRVVSTERMALWFSGYYSGKRGATMIDASAIRPNAAKVQDYCGLHQDETVMHAVEVLFGVK
jgi:acid stress chaperone HdeB